MAATRDSRYDQARRTFDELDVEEQATFLVEAAASTLARGVRTVGEALADGLEDVLRRQRRSGDPTGRRHGPGAAEPETAQRQSPRSGASSAADHS